MWTAGLVGGLQTGGQKVGQFGWQMGRQVGGLVEVEQLNGWIGLWLVGRLGW